MIGLPTSSLPALSLPVQTAEPTPLAMPKGIGWAALAAVLTIGPVFVQAPLVRWAPMVATLATLPLVGLALMLTRHRDPALQRLGLLLVGFAGSWLGGCLFWGWGRSHPVLHLPIEGFALPLAIGGLRTRWRLGACFYLASFLGTALTDGLIALTGLMPFWPPVVAAPPATAATLLQEAAQALLHPWPLLALLLAALAIGRLARALWAAEPGRIVASAVLASTLVVDGVFFGAALLAPHLSGLI